MYICLVNTPELPTPFTHMVTSSKFCRGWENIDFRKIEITDNKQLDDIPDDENTIFLIANHGVETNGYDVTPLKAFSRFTKAIKLLWHFHSYLRLGNEVPFNNWILTGEHYRNPVKSAEHLKSYEFQNSIPNYFPLSFAAYFHPDEIGTFERNNLIYDTVFCGHPYKSHWLSQLSNSFINTNPLSVSEEKRLEAFLSSHTSCGFHSENNVLNSCLVERVFEGMALGTIVLTDNPAGPQVTDNIVELVSSFEELQERIQFYKNNPDLAEAKRQLGYEWIRTKGTYTHVAIDFLVKMQELGFRS
jgi:hypothetical protein